MPAGFAKKCAKKRNSETAASLSGDGPLTFFDYDDLCDVEIDSTRAAGRLSDAKHFRFRVA